MKPEPPDYDEMRAAVLKAHDVRLERSDPVLATVTILDLTMRHYAAYCEKAVSDIVFKFEQQASIQGERIREEDANRINEARTLLNDVLKASQKILEKDRADRLAGVEEVLKERQERLAHQLSEAEKMIKAFKWCLIGGGILGILCLGAFLFSTFG